MLVLDSGGVSRLAERSRQAAALILAFRELDLWPPLVPSVVLVECLQGHAGRDALTNRFLRICDVVEVISETLARRAALLRRQAHRGGCRKSKAGGQRSHLKHASNRHLKTSHHARASEMLPLDV